MLTAIILADNEEKNIDCALKSVSFCDEVIVMVDASSLDSTEEIAKKREGTVIKTDISKNFAAARNLAMEKATREWILFVDADEEVSPELAVELQQSVKGDDISAYYIRRRDFFWGKELKWGEVLKTRQQGMIRLVKKDSGKWQGAVHEEFMTKKPAGHLRFFLNHFPHPEIAQFLKEINLYSSLRAEELFLKKRKTHVFEIITYPFFKFIYTYFILLGILDGAAGFVYSFMMSFHSFLVRSKLYLKSKQK